MKKFKLFSIIALFVTFISGCGCSKIDEGTYASAVDNFKNTDAINFSRIETISEIGETLYVRKKIDAKLIFDANKNVGKMEYHLSEIEGSSGGGSTSLRTLKYYYNNQYLYTYSKVGESQLERYKQAVSTYNSRFNVNVCEDSDCMLLISSNIAPVFKLDAVEDFEINEDGVSKFKAVCPSFENCASNSQFLEYTVVIDNDANIKSISYDIVNGDTIYSIKYSFTAFSSNNVIIEFPGELDNYIEK